MKLHALVVALIVSAAGAGCGSKEFDDDCSHQMDDLRDRYGAPQSVSRARSGDSYAEIWYYPTFARGFAWTEGITKSCDITDY
jgi:hypothetical protein